MVSIIAAAIVIGLIIELILLALLLRSLGSYKQYWEQRAAQPIPSNALIYVALGDSSAQGIGATSPTKGYVGLLADSLATKHRRPVHVINLSVSGAKVEDVIAVQLPKLRNLKIKDDTIITLSIGANDVYRGLQPDTFRQEMDQLLGQLPKQTVVADIPYFGGGRVRSRESGAIEGTAIIHTLAKKHRLRVAPLYETTKRHDNFFTTYAADWFHPSNVGYKNWYQAFWNVLDHE